jgi:hypothetical protein
MADAWPGSPDDAEYGRVRTSAVETLLVGGELDVATPLQIAAKQLLPYICHTVGKSCWQVSIACPRSVTSSPKRGAV